MEWKCTFYLIKARVELEVFWVFRKFCLRCHEVFFFQNVQINLRTVNSPQKSVAPRSIGTKNSAAQSRRFTTLTFEVKTHPILVMVSRSPKLTQFPERVFPNLSRLFFRLFSSSSTFFFSSRALWAYLQAAAITLLQPSGIPPLFKIIATGILTTHQIIAWPKVV